MTYHGMEIDMLSVGDGDAILVTYWRSGSPLYVLIDGGGASAVDVVASFLRARRISFIDHVVCSHPHDDHAGGLSELLKLPDFEFGKLWLHVPTWHVDTHRVRRTLVEAKMLKELRYLDESLKITEELLQLARTRRIPVEEPFCGKLIGFLTVCGPSEQYYEELVNSFSNPEVQKRLEGADRLDLLQDVLEQLGGRAEGLLDEPVTAPQNNASVILCCLYEGDKYLFTADAGVEALRCAANAYDLEGCWWMQIPHHGSRRNINIPLIEHFRPRIAYVSAKGSRKHPRRAVVNAFKKMGATVYSTHYPHDGHLRYSTGYVPDRPGYVRAVPLWDDAT